VPPCNLKKGIKTMSELRAWQAEALERLLRRADDFLCVATPGAGKTRFALAAAARLMERGEVARILVVVPTSHLRTQWAQAAARMGIQLDPTYTNAAGVLAKDYDGAAVTYAGVDSAPLLYRKLSSDKPTLVILDEIHHAGDSRAWGDSVRVAFEHAARRLALSGTPFRSDGRAIPFVRYDENLRCVADYTYDYADALGDQNNNVVRQVQFHAFDGEARWREAGAVESRIRLTDVDEETRGKALSSALHPDGAWIASVLRQADAQLSLDRQTTPDVGGLVIARGQTEARRYASLLRTICGEEPALVISDEPDASARITAFMSTRSRWIVAVAMVSEGVDIPRLTVGVYATNVAAELFFRQVVGRFVRTRPADEEIVASLFIPSVQPLLGYAAEIERMIPKALEEAIERAAASRKDAIQLEINLVEPLASSEAVHLATILGGEQFADEELKRAEEMARLVGMPGNVSPAHIARLLRMAGTPRQPVATVEIPAIALVDEKRQVRKLITAKVNRLHRLTERQHNYINADLNRTCGTTVATADLDGLKQRLTILDRWIAEAAP
jgi:superfamily II DNA or RNA helicase